MTRDDIIRMAREAGIPPVEITSAQPVLYPAPDAIEQFARLVAAAERKACAKVCEPQSKWDDPLTAFNIAAAIRKRGNP